MPQAQHRGNYIMGKPRASWVRDAARAIINSTTAEGRFRMMRDGYLKFETFAKSAFANDTPFRFTSTELRWIYAYIERHHERELKKNPRLRAGLIKLLEHSRKVVAN